MIYGIGHDVVENKRIECSLNKYQQNFIKKVLSSKEQINLIKANSKVKYIAKRFAAKEAFVKACGTGFRGIFTLPKITVENDQLGKPFFTFDTSINNWLEKQNIISCHLSISDEITIASAFVILEMTF